MKFKRLVLYDLKSEPLEKEFIEKLKVFAKEVVAVFAEKEYSGGLHESDLKGADALIARLFDSYDDKLFMNRTLKYVGAMHTDYSHYNLELLKNWGITLTSVPGYCTEAVAELTISALLNISRKTHDGMNFVKQGNWGFEKFMGWELKGKTLGIIGLGKIGSRVAEIASSLGMNVIYYSPHKKINSKAKYFGLDELISRSDVISLHCVLSDETKNLLSRNRLSLMKNGAVLLDSARSELVDLDAVYGMCSKGRIHAWFEAIEDKTWRDKFAKMDNVYLTPHFGWMTREAQQNLKEITLGNIKSYLEGKPKNRAV